MNKSKSKKRKPLEGTQVVSPIATGGAGGVFQARVATLYLANMLTGAQTTFGLQGGRVRSLRVEARYTGAHTDDIYCRLQGKSSEWLQLVQCKRGLDAVPSNTDFVESLEGAWRDYLGVEKSPFERSCDVLVIATVAPSTAASRAAKRICELSRASSDLGDLLQKLQSGLFNAQHKRTWESFVTVSKATLEEKYSDVELFSLLRRLRIDIHDLGSDSSQELSLVHALLESDSPGGYGERVWNGLFTYAFEQGVQVGTITPATWKDTASQDLQALVSGVSVRRGLADTVDRFSVRAERQLSLIATSLPNNAHIPRTELIARVIDAFDTHQAVVVAGSAGAGKSGVLAELAPVLVESGPLFFFRADELDHSSLSTVLTSGGMTDGLVGMDTMLEACARPTVVIDSLEKALESQERGALEELLALVRKHPNVRLCVTTRSYALNALFANFLYQFSLDVVDVPPLTDDEMLHAVAGTPLERLVRIQGHIRDVLRAPFYIRLALTHTASGAAIPGTSTTDIRFVLWSEKVAPTSGQVAHLSTRRRAAFEQVCYARTERFAQFVERPSDAEAILALIQDGVLVSDLADRVAPAHDVLEDWALFFKVEREVRATERDWSRLFEKLGTHAGMRRALRSWIAERSAVNDDDALALLETSLSPTEEGIPQLWRDEVAIGLLRSDAVETLIDKLSLRVNFDNAALLQRLAHLLRVACKGPTSVDYSDTEDSPSYKEARLRLGMAAPVGKAWDILIKLVAEAFPRLSPENHLWVVKLAEDALSHDVEWFRPSRRTKYVFEMAESICIKDEGAWHREETIGKRFFALLCRSCGGAPDRFSAFIESLINRRAQVTSRRDFEADERLTFLVDIRHSREPSRFTPNLVWRVFSSLYLAHGPRERERYGAGRWEEQLGLTALAEHAFFPPSALQGPFRQLLLHALPGSVRMVVELCNHCARSFARAEPGSVLMVPAEESPNGKLHFHCDEFWTAYRGLHVTSYLLNSALMALEERLLLEAKPHPQYVTHVLELILELGESTLTTGLVAGVLSAHPELMTERLLAIFKCPEFFSSDLGRTVHETSALAINGGNDGLDEARQQERIKSNRLEHRKVSLETLLLRLQFDFPHLRDAIFSVLDRHIENLAGAPSAEFDGWRVALKRMDARGLRLGPPTPDGKYRVLEIADLDEDLKLASDEAQLRLGKTNRIAGLRVWAAAVTGRFSTADQKTRDAYNSATEAYSALLRVQAEDSDNELALFGSLDEDIACAICTKWPDEASQALAWARNEVLQRAAAQREDNARSFGDQSLGEVRAHTVVGLAARDPDQSFIADALANVATEPVWKLRHSAASAVASVLMAEQPALAAIVVDGMAQFAAALEAAEAAPYQHGRDKYVDTRVNVRAALACALRDINRLPRPSPTGLRCVKEWLIAISAARTEEPATWRVDALLCLVHLAVEAEQRPRTYRDEEESIDYEAKVGLARVFASELLAPPETSSTALFDMLEHCIDGAPELGAQTLEAALLESDRAGFKNADALWRIWDIAMRKVFVDEALRMEDRWYRSKHEKSLAVLLFASVPWREDLRDLSLLHSRARFIPDALAAVGDTRRGLRYLLRLAAGVGRVSAVPGSLPALRSALSRAPSDLLADSNCLWNAETICHVAVHEHRETLLRDVRLRRATLDILDRLVDAGSSLAFQLRDYLATSPPASGLPNPIAVQSVGMPAD